jgi:type II secretory pathway pseudopilin PulG
MRSGREQGHQARRGAQAGFAYLIVMMLVATVGVLLAEVADGWHENTRRLKEKQLLFAGRQIRQAIVAYYERAPAQAPRFPFALADLLRDPRQSGTVRYLREIYRDPMTGSTDWGLVKSATGEIVGVYSRALEKPLKQGNFTKDNRDFQGAARYADWVFVFSPGRYTAPAPSPAGQSNNNR